MFLPSLIGYREGVKLVAAKIKAKWMHWSHSVPQKSLGEGSEAIPGHVYVALAHEHIEGVARMYGCSAELVPVVWNPSDILDTIDSRARLIADQLDLLDCDILGVLPFSIGRIDQKGIHHALQLYAALSKKRRVKVLLCNSLSGTEEAQKNVEMWDRRMKEQVDAVGPGDLSWWWMSRVMEQWDRWTPNEVIRDLQRLSNVFIYPTIGEGFSLAIGEALAAGPLCILPQEGVRGMRELEALGGVLLLRLRNKPWREEKDIRPREELAAEIEPHLEPHVSRLRRQYALSRGGIWKRMLEPAISKHVRE
jgi:hypothetical protein